MRKGVATGTPDFLGQGRARQRARTRATLFRRLHGRPYGLPTGRCIQAWAGRTGARHPPMRGWAGRRKVAWAGERRAAGLDQDGKPRPGMQPFCVGGAPPNAANARDAHVGNLQCADTVKAAPAIAGRRSCTCGRQPGVIPDHAPVAPRQCGTRPRPTARDMQPQDLPAKLHPARGAPAAHGQHEAGRAAWQPVRAGQASAHHGACSLSPERRASKRRLNQALQSRYTAGTRMSRTNPCIGYRPYRRWQHAGTNSKAQPCMRYVRRHVEGRLCPKRWNGKTFTPCLQPRGHERPGVAGPSRKVLVKAGMVGYANAPVETAMRPSQGLVRRHVWYGTTPFPAAACVEAGPAYARSILYRCGTAPHPASPLSPRDLCSHKQSTRCVVRYPTHRAPWASRTRRSRLRA